MGADASTKPKSSLRARIITAAVASVITIGVLQAPIGWPFAIFAALTLWAAAWELGDLLEWDWPQRVLATLAALGAIATASTLYILQPKDADTVMGLLLLLLSLGIAGALYALSKSMRWLGILMLAAPLLALVAMHEWSATKWPHPLFIVLVPIWAGDTAAYFIGKSFGKAKIAPKLSPNKTWAGGIAHLAAAVATGAALTAAYGQPVIAGLAVGFLVSLLGQAGDFFESHLKRRVDVKDSGTLLPGHGGVMDRLDSLLISAIPASWTLIALAPDLFTVSR